MPYSFILNDRTPQKNSHTHTHTYIYIYLFINGYPKEYKCYFLAWKFVETLKDLGKK
jgi:hypothetical protein